MKACVTDSLCLASFIQMMFLRFLHVAEYISASCLFSAESCFTVWVCHDLLILSPVGGCLDCFLCRLAVVNIRAMSYNSAQKDKQPVKHEQICLQRRYTNDE